MSHRRRPPSDKSLQGLANYQDRLVKDKRLAIQKAICHLRETNALINISTVAAHAGVARKTVYKHRDLIAVIDRYRRHRATVDVAATSHETSIIAGLRIQLTAKDNEIKTLRAKVQEHESTIALLYGRLDTCKP